MTQRGLRPSARMREVLYWAALGKSNPEIATILGISVHTVKQHFRDLAIRYGVHGTNSRVTVVAFALVRGDLELEQLRHIQELARGERREPSKALAHRIS